MAGKPYNAHYERPATLALLPDVAGLHCLDLGCGPGDFARALLDRGATVVAVDVTPRMVEIARGRLGAQATVLCADAEEPLSFAADAEFDFVLAPLMLDYLDDWRPLFHEIARVLKPGGRFQFSIGHPQSDFRIVRERVDAESNYFEREVFDYPWRSWGEPVKVMRSFRRPMSEVLMPLIETGLRLERFVEPRPAPSFRELDPESYAKLMKEPNFLCVRAIRDSSRADRST